MLTGKMVRLRAQEPDDLERDYTWINDREVTRFLTMRYPLSHADERRWLEDRPANGFAGVRLAIETLDGTHIGNIDLHGARPEDRHAVLGVSIGQKTHWSSGYGTDAVVTLLRFAFEEMNLNRVWLSVDDDNGRAIACYRKCGFREEVRLRGERYTEAGTRTASLWASRGASSSRCRARRQRGKEDVMLQGTLVRLRAPEPEDRERVRTWVNDPEVTRWLTDRYPRSLVDEVWLVDGPTNGFEAGVRLAIETNEGRHIGAINLHQTRPEDRKAGLGIIIGDNSHWSKGYGRDAIVTLLRFAFHEMNLHRVWLTVADGHEAAIACYRTCGFREEARLRREVYRHGRYWDFVVMGVLRREFDAFHHANVDDEKGGSDA